MENVDGSFLFFLWPIPLGEVFAWLVLTFGVPFLVIEVVSSFILTVFLHKVFSFNVACSHIIFFLSHFAIHRRTTSFLFPAHVRTFSPYPTCNYLTPLLSTLLITTGYISTSCPPKVGLVPCCAVPRNRTLGTDTRWPKRAYMTHILPNWTNIPLVGAVKHRPRAVEPWPGALGV